MKKLWRLADAADEYPWDGYTWLAAGETPEDAMRAVITKLKKDRERWRGMGIEPSDPLPTVMLAIEMTMPERAVHLDVDLHDIGEAFGCLFEGEAVEVRL